MSSIEEPMTATELAGAIEDDNTTIDLDDVEGHGMREVAAGLGAAAVLAGAGTAAAAAVGVHPSLPNLKASTPSVSDPVGTVDRTTDRAIEIARDARDTNLSTAGATAAGASTAAGQQVSATSATTARVAAGAQQTADAFGDAAGTIAAKEAKAATTAATAAVSSTRTVASAATTTASSATTTASSTTTDTARKAATVLQLTASTANALETTIVATVETLNPEAGAGTSGMGSAGWVTFSIGGENVASVQLSNGQASVTVKTASIGGKVLQAVYSGTDSTTSSMRTITL